MTVQSHATARGVGIIAYQWLRHLGATVIGTVGDAEKVAERVCDIAGGKSAPFLTRPTLPHYTATRDELVETASDLSAVVGWGAVKKEARQGCALNDAKDAKNAHRDIEAHKTTGSPAMLP